MILGMSNSPSKLKGKCLQAIRDQPGILQSEMSKMGIGHRQTITEHVFSLCFNGSVVRVRDEVMHSYRLYPRGKEPQINCEETLFRRSLHQRSSSLFFSEPAHYNINKGHGDKFFMAFDEASGLLYIDLKMIAGACSE